MLIDIAPVCERIIDESRAVHPEANILVTMVESAEGQFDGARLEQVFSNLIGNAVQHGASHSPVTVTLDSTDGKMQFTVHNMGKPIPQDVLPFIFNPMGRYSPEASTENGPYASLGLGLFIVSQIVSAHHGTVEVTSTADMGTTFIVEIPLNSAVSG